MVVARSNCSRTGVERRSNRSRIIVVTSSLVLSNHLCRECTWCSVGYSSASCVRLQLLQLRFLSGANVKLPGQRRTLTAGQGGGELLFSVSTVLSRQAGNAQTFSVVDSEPDLSGDLPSVIPATRLLLALTDPGRGGRLSLLWRKVAAGGLRFERARSPPPITSPAQLYRASTVALHRRYTQRARIPFSGSPVRRELEPNRTENRDRFPALMLLISHGRRGVYRGGESERQTVRGWGQTNSTSHMTYRLVYWPGYRDRERERESNQCKANNTTRPTNRAG